MSSLSTVREGGAPPANRRPSRRRKPSKNSGDSIETLHHSGGMPARDQVGNEGNQVIAAMLE